MVVFAPAVALLAGFIQDQYPDINPDPGTVRIPANEHIIRVRDARKPLRLCGTVYDEHRKAVRKPSRGHPICIANVPRDLALKPPVAIPTGLRLCGMIHDRSTRALADRRGRIISRCLPYTR